MVFGLYYACFIPILHELVKFCVHIIGHQLINNFAYWCLVSVLCWKQWYIFVFIFKKTTNYQNFWQHCLSLTLSLPSVNKWGFVTSVDPNPTAHNRHIRFHTVCYSSIGFGHKKARKSIFGTISDHSIKVFWDRLTGRVGSERMNRFISIVFLSLGIKAQIFLYLNHVSGNAC